MTSRGARVPPFPPGYRASGVLLHITSLPSAYGIGDLGPGALRWVDRLHESGQSWWQALPLGPTGYADSPYQCLSSFAGNELLISPDGLIDDELLGTADCVGHAFSPTAVEYEKVVPFKLRVFETALSRFRAGARSDLRPAYEQFCQAHGLWLDDYALFRALKDRYQCACYLEWPVELLRRTPAALDRERHELANQIELVRFAQFLLSRQAQRLAQHAHDKGVQLIGDLPFFVSPDSSDVWSNPGFFLLGKGELSDPQRQNVWSYLRRSGGAVSEVAPALMHLAWESVAALAIAPLQDLLNLGNEARMNVPGRAEGNWRWRCTEEMLSAHAFEWLRDLTNMSGRSPSQPYTTPV